MSESPEERLARLEREHAELIANLPAHSTQPTLLIRLEDLEDAIAALRAKLDAASGEEPPPPIVEKSPPILKAPVNRK